MTPQQPCPANYLGAQCQLPPNHHGDHQHTTEHANAVHETLWTDETRPP